MKLVTSFSLPLAAALASRAMLGRMIRAQVLSARGLGYAMRLRFHLTVRMTPGYHPVVWTGFHKLLFWRI